MSPLRALLASLLLTPAAVHAVVTPVSSTDVYQESGGIVVMEAERTPSSLGSGSARWELYEPGETNFVAGATNNAHLEFQGNSSNGGPATAPLTYKFRINQGGYYHLHLRARARLDGADSDKNNDCYVRVNGDSYGAGPNAGDTHLKDATLSLLTNNTKLYGASPTTWGWSDQLDAGGEANKRWPVYNFVSGGTYTLTISGRSIKYNFDRIVFRKSTISTSSAKSATLPESSTGTGGTTGQSIATLMLVNADTDDDIGPITNGMTINLAVTGANLNVRADTSPSIVGSVRFGLDGVADFMTQSSAPYTLGGDAPGDDYLPWTPSLGSHTLVATPFTAASGGGTVGSPTTLNFTVINTPPSGSPVASAGSDRSITLPTSSVVINGSGTDSGGSISGYSWSQVSGPSNATLSGGGTANLTASGLVQGSYVFRLTVTDNSGLTGYDDLTVTVNAAAGVPVANAGSDKAITLPTSSVVFNGSGTDSGGSISAYSWSQVSGPSTATLSGQGTANLTASGLVQGPYVFRLTVTDNSGLTATDNVTVTVSAATGGSGQSVTTLMLIDADTDSEIGPIQNGSTIDLAVVGANLNIRADTSPNPVGSVRFSLNDVADYATQTNAPYAMGGDALTDFWPWTPPLGSLTVTATPYTAAGGTGVAGTAKTVTFTVINSQLTGDPVAHAGQDKAVVLPTASVIFNGTGTDMDGSISSYSWTQISGPNTATLSNRTTTNLTAASLVQGTYVFRLTVTDNANKTATDDVTLNVLPAGSGSALITGEMKKWHKVTLSFTGPTTSETASPNPFTDYRLNVTFTHLASGKSYVVPGFFAADGNAANTSATSGNVWRVHFAPDETGAWSYNAAFRAGTNIATLTSAGASGGFFDGDTGSFNIAATDKTGIDFRGKGRLEYVGKHHLRFAETGQYFMKAGTDAPENLLSYADFDGDFKTDGQGDSYVKNWSPHTADWQAGDPVWQGTKGKGLIGAINYLAAEGLNAFSFLTMNINGDDKNVFPYTTYAERSRFDVSRLDQWETIFEHGTRKGMHLNFKTQETENELLLDSGNLGTQRKLYYRELIARFGHHPALNWNLGEEIDSASTSQKQSWAQYFHDSDPYKHPIVIHNSTGSLHRDLLGSASKLTGFSLQLNASDFTDMFSMTKDYIDRSDDADRPWVVACDEPGDAQYALRPDSDPGSSHVNARKNALWGNIMAGGAGCEFYFGYALAHSDLTCQDFRSRDDFWDYCRYALQFFAANPVPFEQMTNRNSLVSGNGNNANRCLAQTGHTYLVQLHGGGTHTLNLSGTTGTFTVKWFDPRNGGALLNGPTVSGGGTVSLGAPPNNTSQDWVALVQSTNIGGGATNQSPVVSAGADKSVVLSGSSVPVSLTGTATDDGLPEDSLLSRTWSQVSGPAVVNFSSTTTATTTATFTVAGNYVLRFSASDTALSASDDVAVHIAAPAGTGGQTVLPVHDAYTEGGANNNNTQLRLEKSSTRTRITFLQFDLSGLGSAPSSAVVRLTEGDDTSSGTMTLRLYAATSNSWTESNVSSSNQPAKGAQVAVFTGDVTDGKVIDFDVASHVTAAGIYSFILEADSSTKDVSFASKENATVSARPALVVGTSSAGNAPPTHPGYSFTTGQNEPILVPFALLLTGASDPDGDPVSVLDASTTSAAGGSIALGGDSLTYSPASNFSGSDSFTLTIHDGRGGIATATMTVLVQGSDDGISGYAPPVLQRISASQMRLSFTGKPNTSYRFQRSINLSAWSTLQTLTAGSNGQVQFTDSNPPAGNAFYRIATP
ncbi:tandem-95 repeat protein [Luteolibacter arcticus]|uniref:Tandem-95 repeat protein n=1 Tax=Luteolibacter arcticus TaxID=1581411 RepID=A0ABT3GJJ6_9BACT|nr:tandem-95 repeat protein [Luteolibacter arcticus]MCW1923697.1 tandem-95 repeat protein [Luteolibacter arcticus]